MRTTTIEAAAPKKEGVRLQVSLRGAPAGERAFHIHEVGKCEGPSLNGKPNSVFHSGGTAFVIHQGGDDYKTDPDGAAGERIACGVIEPGGSSAVAPAKK